MTKIPDSYKTCNTCKYGDGYVCRRHAPVHVHGELDGQFPSIYRNSSHVVCGDWEAKPECIEDWKQQGII